MSSATVRREHRAVLMTVAGKLAPIEERRAKWGEQRRCRRSQRLFWSTRGHASPTLLFPRGLFQWRPPFFSAKLMEARGRTAGGGRGGRSFDSPKRPIHTKTSCQTPHQKRLAILLAKTTHQTDLLKCLAKTPCQKCLTKTPCRNVLPKLHNTTPPFMYYGGT